MAWLVEYLTTKCQNVTSLIVSHDSGFLDKVRPPPAAPSLAAPGVHADPELLVQSFTPSRPAPSRSRPCQVCTGIIHYEKNLKLKKYRGNLSELVKHKPEAKSYYTLQAATTKWVLPEPGFLEGVNSKASGCGGGAGRGGRVLPCLPWPGALARLPSLASSAAPASAGPPLPAALPCRTAPSSRCATSTSATPRLRSASWRA